MSGSSVARVELYHFSAPLPATFRPSWIPGLPQRDNRCTLIHVITEDGVEGWSAGAAISKERAGLGDILGPYFLGEDASDIALVQQRLREASYIGWRNWWIEPAFWDIKGKMEGRSVAKLLTDWPLSSVKLYASSGEVRDAPEVLAYAEARRDEGFDTFKMRVHRDEVSDVQQVTETGAALGGEMDFGVDANQAWRVTIVADAPLWDLERASRFADACRQAGAAWIEEPLPMDAYDDLAELTKRSQVPIAGGELHTSGYPELKMMIERGCYSIFQPDATFTGGIDQTWRIAQLCREHGLGYTPHTWTNGVGFAINLQLMAASRSDRQLEYPLDPPGWVPEARDAMLEQPFFHDKATLQVPDAPGLGITIDPKALRKHGKRFFVMDRKRLTFFALKDRGLKVAREMDATKRSRLKS